MTPEQINQFKEWKVPLPTREPHGTEEDIRANLKPLTPSKWRLEGNKLIAETDMGELVNYIPTDYIMKGVDEQGLPILKKIGIS
jgi:hypothetical protein